MKFATSKVEPIGTRTAYGHINRGRGNHEWGPFEIPDYPRSENGQRLRALRVSKEVGLRDTAKALGLSALELSELERGARTTDDWPALLAAVDALTDARNGGAP